MKKIISLLAVLAAGFGFASAQNFTATCNGKAIANGDVIEVCKLLEAGDDMEADFMITSTSDADIDFSMKFEDVQPAEAVVTICGFGGCRAGNSIDNETLEPGKTYGGEGDKIDIAYIVGEKVEKVTMKVTMSDNTAGEDLVFTLVFNPTSSEEGFTATYEGNAIANGDVIEVCKLLEAGDDMEADFMITSTSDADIDFSMKFEDVQPAEAVVTICGFGGCRAGNSIDNETLEPGKTYGGEGDKIDIAHIVGEKAEKVTMKVTMSNNTNGKALVFTLVLDPTRNAEGVANQTVAEVIAAAYPNPASEVVNFRLNNVKAGATVVLRDLSGKALRQVVAADEVSMNLQGLSAGMYFYTVEEQGVRMATGKLVIR